MDGAGVGQRRMLWGLLSLACVAGIAGALFLGGKAVARDEAAAASQARTRATLQLAPLLSSQDLAAPVEGDRYDDLLRDVREGVLADSPFTGLTLWDPEARIVFSTDPGTVGQQVVVVHERIRRVMRAGVETAVVGGTFQTWVPLRLKLDGPVVGVARFDQPYAPLWNRANRPWRIAAIGFGVL
ncbi:MAG TPA: hypothetical protein VNO17_04970, partial [Actinomycetota bacterium]|nr:hypothetical protein [Actinomycetota bacterium]